jgi:hypothetical protein
MIFISMSPEELLTRTAQYQIRYTSNSRPGDPHDRRPANSRHRGIPQTVSAEPISNHPRSHNLSLDSDSEDEYQNLAQDRHNANLDRHPTPTPDAMLFRVTTDFDDKSDVDEDERPQSDHFQVPLGHISRASWLSPYPQRDSDSSESEDDDDGSDENNPGGDPGLESHRATLLHRTPRSHQDFHRIASRRRNMPSLIEATGPEVGNGSQNSALELGARSDVMVPHARFFIERHKSMVNLKFDPPV